MLVIGVNGSPHASHNTGYLVKKVLEGAKQSGARTRLFHPQKMDIHPCKACMVCKKKYRICSIKDDMYGFYDSVEDGCALVMGTPVYFDHVTAQFKMFLDRMYPFLGPDLEKRFPENVKAVLVVTYEMDDRNAYGEIIKWIKGRLKGYYGVKTAGVLKVHSCPEKLVVDKKKRTVEKALRLGAGLI
jgi:multimeric flavodoxin WrbA